jgi:hypothetical protein
VDGRDCVHHHDGDCDRRQRCQQPGREKQASAELGNPSGERDKRGRPETELSNSSLVP